jgi:hypothetical protein
MWRIRICARCSILGIHITETTSTGVRIFKIGGDHSTRSSGGSLFSEVTEDSKRLLKYPRTYYSYKLVEPVESSPVAYILKGY